ncbi:MAG: hypothetical protein IJN50_06800 [Clostridia bacterium]|nr:hypothetical protein [Clostridia bacterium]
MPRNYNRYQYETSPRKLKPEYTPAKNPYKQKKTTINKNENQKKKNTIKNKNKKAKTIMYIALAFSILFTISYRNAQIDENFSEVQDLKKELALLEKENEQLEVSIESNLNLSNLEEQARDLLGMHKLTSKQTIYVDLPKSDYIQSSAEKIVMEEEGLSFKSLFETITNLFK